MKSTTINIYQLGYKELIRIVESYILTHDPESNSNLGPDFQKTLQIAGVDITPGSSIILKVKKKEI